MIEIGDVAASNGEGAEKRVIRDVEEQPAEITDLVVSVIGVGDREGQLASGGFGNSQSRRRDFVAAGLGIQYKSK